MVKSKGTSILSERQWVCTALGQVTNLGYTRISRGLDQNADPWDQHFHSKLVGGASQQLAFQKQVISDSDASDSGLL